LKENKARIEIKLKARISFFMQIRLIKLICVISGQRYFVKNTVKLVLSGYGHIKHLVLFK
jgi:hypothetical protein